MNDDWKDRQCNKCGECVGYGQKHDCAQKLTLFLCGPRKCEHDYSGFRTLDSSTEGYGGTAVCSKCGASAIMESMWS